MLTTIITALITSGLASLLAFFKLKTEFKTQFMAETAVKTLLENEKWKQRSFDEIKKRLGGFEDDELRKILVRSGAVRFSGDEEKELWGLMSRNLDKL